MTLTDIIIAIIIGLSTGILAWWIQSLIGDPHESDEDLDGINTRAIFSFIGVWAANGYWKLENALEAKSHKITDKHSQQKYEAMRLNYFKMIVCPYCNMVWIAIFFGSTMIWLTEISFWHLLYVPSLGHLSLKYVMDKF